MFYVPFFRTLHTESGSRVTRTHPHGGAVAANQSEAQTFTLPKERVTKYLPDGNHKWYDSRTTVIVVLKISPGRSSLLIRANEEGRAYNWRSESTGNRCTGMIMQQSCCSKILIQHNREQFEGTEVKLTGSMSLSVFSPQYLQGFLEKLGMTSLKLF